MLTLACALEMPMSFCVSMEDLSFRFLEPSDEQIYAQIMQSVEYIRTIANIIMPQLKKAARRHSAGSLFGCVVMY